MIVWCAVVDSLPQPAIYIQIEIQIDLFTLKQQASLNDDVQ